MYNQKYFVDQKVSKWFITENCRFPCEEPHLLTVYYQRNYNLPI